MHKDDIARLDKVTTFVSEASLVELTQEMLSMVGFTVEAVLAVNSRAKALESLVMLALVAKNNPLLDLVAEYGELPAEITMLIPSAAQKGS